MPQSLAHTALIVRDYDEVIAWFTGVLGFTLAADERVGPEQVAVSPGHGCEHPGDVHTSSGPPRQPEQDKHGAISAEGGSDIATSKRWVLVATPGAATIGRGRC